MSVSKGNSIRIEGEELVQSTLRLIHSFSPALPAACSMDACNATGVLNYAAVSPPLPLHAGRQQPLGERVRVGRAGRPICTARTKLGFNLRGADAATAEMSGFYLRKTMALRNFCALIKPNQGCYWKMFHKCIFLVSSLTHLRVSYLVPV